MKTSLWVTVLALTVSVTFASAADANKVNSDLTSICELVKNWGAYHGRVVNVRAIYTEKVVQQERLYDPSCLDLGEIAVKWPSHLPTSMKKEISNLDKIIAKDSQKRAWVVIQATFYGPRPFTNDEIPSALPPAMKEMMRKSHMRYGYMDTLDGMVQIIKLFDAKEVAAGEKSPFPL